MKRMILSFLTCILLAAFFHTGAVLALTPFPSFNSYFEYYPAKSGSGQANSIVFNVTPEQLYGQQFFGIEIPLTNNRAPFPDVTSTDANVNQHGWSGGDWTCTKSATSVRCIGKVPMNQGGKTCIAVYFGGAFSPPSYLSINILDADGLKKVGLGVEYKTGKDAETIAPITGVDITTSGGSAPAIPVVPVPKTGGSEIPPMESTSVETPKIAWEYKEITKAFPDATVIPPNKVLNTGNALIFGVLLALGTCGGFLLLRSVSYKTIGMGLAAAAIGTGITVFFNLTDGVTLWACPDTCENGQCQNFQISKIVVAKYGEDPDGVSKEKIVLKVAEFIGQSFGADRVTKTIGDSYKEAGKVFSKFGEAFAENEAMRDKIYNGVQLYVYFQREKCKTQFSCWGLQRIYYEWEGESIGPVRIPLPGEEYAKIKNLGSNRMSQSDIKAAKQPISLAFEAPPKDAWNLAYLTMPENADKLAQYLGWFLKDASAPKWCEP